MGFYDFSDKSLSFQSVSLRTNEEFVRLFNDLIEAECLHRQKGCAFECPSVTGHKFMRSFFAFLFFQAHTKEVDRWMKRVEKNALLSEVLSRIKLQFEQEIFPVLRDFHPYCSGKRINLDDDDTSVWVLMSHQTHLLRELIEVFVESVSSELEPAHQVVVSALSLLSFVYHYLIGCVDKRGSKTYSPGSSLFRLIFVAIVLFLGSYVWIKFRQASHTACRRKRKACALAGCALQLGDASDVERGGVQRRAVKNSQGTHYKFEPRFKPLREQSESGTTLKFNHLSLGSFNTRREAEIVFYIAAVLYGEAEVRPVQFEDGLCLPFPSVTEHEKCPPSGKEKAVWVTHKTREVYADLLRKKASRLQLRHPDFETGSHPGHDGEASRSDPSPSAPGAPSAVVEWTCFTPPHGGNGAVEERATSESHGLGQEPAIAPGAVSAFFSDFDNDQAMSSMPQWEENDLLTLDDLDKAFVDNFETSVFESTSYPPQSIALDSPASAMFASLPPLGVGDQGLGVVEPHLSSATAITFQQLESIPEQVQLQQRVTCQEQRPQEFPGSVIELQQKLLESEERISELQQKLRKAEDENEKLRSLFHQVAKLMSASNLDGNPVDSQ